MYGFYVFESINQISKKKEKIQEHWIQEQKAYRILNVQKAHTN